MRSDVTHHLAEGTEPEVKVFDHGEGLTGTPWSHLYVVWRPKGQGEHAPQVGSELRILGTREQFEELHAVLGRALNPPAGRGRREGPYARQSDESLVEYVERHGFKAEATGGGIRVESEAVNPETGEAETVEEFIRPELSAVREWLGY